MSMLPARQSLICNEYLEECHPQAAMLPSDPVARAHARIIIDRFNSKYVPAFYRFLIRCCPGAMRCLAFWVNWESRTPGSQGTGPLPRAGRRLRRRRSALTSCGLSWPGSTRRSTRAAHTSPAGCACGPCFLPAHLHVPPALHARCGRGSSPAQQAAVAQHEWLPREHACNVTPSCKVRPPSEGAADPLAGVPAGSPEHAQVGGLRRMCSCWHRYSRVWQCRLLLLVSAFCTPWLQCPFI